MRLSFVPSHFLFALLATSSSLCGCHKKATSPIDVSIRTTLTTTPAALPLDGVTTANVSVSVTTAAGLPRVAFQLDLAPQDGGLYIVQDLAPTDTQGVTTGVVRCLTAGTHDLGLTTQYNNMSVALTDYVPVTCTQVYSVGVPSAQTSLCTANPNSQAVDDPNGIAVVVYVQDPNGAAVGADIPVYLVADSNQVSFDPNMVYTDAQGIVRAIAHAAEAQVVSVTAYLGSQDANAPQVSTMLYFTAAAVSAHASERQAGPNARVANEAIDSDPASRLTDGSERGSKRRPRASVDSMRPSEQLGASASRTASPSVGWAPAGLVCSSLLPGSYVGVPQSFTIEAVDADGHRAQGYRGHVSITTYAPSVTAPSGYAFNSKDAGSTTFVDGVVFDDIGRYNVRIQDVADPHLTCVLRAEVVYETPVVEPLYANATSWNAYIRNDGPLSDATGALCDGVDASGIQASCVHGGGMRAVAVPSAQDCNALTATDNLSAFVWTCDASATPPRMVSQTLAEQKGLTTLIDAEMLAFRPMSVAVQYDGTTLFTTAPAVWWEDSVTAATGGAALQGNSIVVRDPHACGQYTIEHAHTSVIVPDGQTLVAPSN